MLTLLYHCRRRMLKYGQTAVFSRCFMNVVWTLVPNLRSDQATIHATLWYIAYTLVYHHCSNIVSDLIKLNVVTTLPHHWALADKLVCKCSEKVDSFRYSRIQLHQNLSHSCHNACVVNKILNKVNIMYKTRKLYADIDDIINRTLEARWLWFTKIMDGRYTVVHRFLTSCKANNSYISSF